MFDDILKVFLRGIYTIKECSDHMKDKLYDIYTSGHINSDEYLAFNDLVDKWSMDPDGKMDLLKLTTMYRL